MIRHFDLLTIFPRFFDSYFDTSLVAKALQRKLFTVETHDLRQWAELPHRHVDDLPYGGGPGMVFRPEPLFQAITQLKSRYQKGRVIYLSCRAPLLHQKKSVGLSQEYEEILLVCGRYEGIDQRVIDSVIDEEISIGDYVLAGGELAALVLMDTLIRLIPGVMGKESSLNEESFEQGLLEYPHYTRPEHWNGLHVPEVLLSGNHAAIQAWRLEQSVRQTLQVRPELLEKNTFSQPVKKLIDHLKRPISF